MKKRLALSVIIVSILILTSLIIFTATNVSGNSTNPGISKQVYNSISYNGSAQVLIRFAPQKQTFNIMSMIFGTTNNSEKENQIKKEIGKRISYSKNGMIYANINSSQLSELEKISGINITAERVFHITSEAPTAQINITSVQNLIFKGENLTGQGQTICILDTGTDYNNTNLGGCYGYNNASSNCKVIGGYNFINNTDNPMDDNGHGTHVAGIIAASGNLTGVAPGVKIISVKVCDASGNCNEANIQKGLEWCVNNASKFNISVISMSIGTSQLYSGYCNSDPLAPEVNAAVAKNISVVVASGNEGNFAAMSSPACIQTATPVGATYVENYTGNYSWGSPYTCSDLNPRQDQITCFTDRDANLNLLAPGALINSTWLNNGYQEEGGTSMAAPHVSGAIAILKQYFRLNNQSLSPSEAETALNDTGKRIYDNQSNLTFSLIKVYPALISLDTQAPNVSLVLPSNNLATSQKNQTFECNSTDLLLKDTTLKIWNSTGLFYNASKNITGQSNLTSFNVSFENYGTYNWNCFSQDENGNTGSSVQNSTLIISPGIIYLSPANDTYTNKNQTFECNSTYLLSGENLSNVTFSLFNSSDYLIYNKTVNISGTSNQTDFNYNFTNQEKYLWGCHFYTNASNRTDSDNYTITYDTTAPNLSIISPSNGTTLQGTQDVTFLYNITDNFAIKSCTLYISGTNVSENSNITFGENNFTYRLSSGTYNWSINCSDKADNTNASLERILKIQTSQTSSIPSYSGGGALVPSAPEQTVKNITQGYSIEISPQTSYIFNLNSGQHNLTLNALNPNNATFTVQSSPIIFTLSVGQEKYLNLSSPDYYDLYLKLNKIESTKVNLTIKELTTNNRIFHILNNSQGNETTGTTPKTQKPTSKFMFYLEIGVAAALVMLIIFLEIRKRSPKGNQNLKKVKKK